VTNSDRQVRVWLWFADEVAGDLESRFRPWFSDDEQARCDRLKLDRVRLEYVMTRVLVRQSLSLAEPSVAPAAWTFERNEHGKPEVSGPIGAGTLRFNVSNTYGLVACAITRHNDLGVDVEARDRNSDGIAIADRYFSVQEVTDLKALPTSQQAHRFFEYWTLKEAYIKARGLGLAIPLGQFSFRLDGRADIGIAFDPKLKDRADQWSFALHSPSSRHQLAVALRGGTQAIELIVEPFRCP
jgi:4'-phosphopantetheinyl transferase